MLPYARDQCKRMIALQMRFSMPIPETNTRIDVWKRQCGRGDRDFYFRG
jgi:hypothetical protein